MKKDGIEISNSGIAFVPKSGNFWLLKIDKCHSLKMGII